jgi:hypothetical protein
MQKLVIHTQYRENYGAHDWDGTGECPQYWKFKGGNTYVVPNFKDFNNVNGVISKLIAEAGITYKNYGSEEYILDWDIVPHSEKVCEDWETPTEIFIHKDKITAMKVIDNREDGWLKREILEQTETWTMLPENERKDYSTTFLMEDGDIVEGQAGLKEWFNSQEAA